MIKIMALENQIFKIIMFDEKNLEISKEKLKDIIHKIDPLIGRIDQKNLIILLEDGVNELRLALAALNEPPSNEPPLDGELDNEIPY